MSQHHYEFYDFYIPSADPEAMAKRAKELGFSGIVVTKFDKKTKILIPDEFSVYYGVDIQAMPSKIREEIRKYRNSDLISIVKGCDEETIRKAAESGSLDILMSPVEFNNVIAKISRDNSVAIGFNLGSIIRQRGQARIKEFQNMRTILKHARKYRLNMVLTNDPESIHDLRSPRDMIAIASLFGMTQSEAVEALSATPDDILRRKNPGYIQEGIELL